MSTHLRYADDTTVVHCPETENNEPRKVAPEGFSDEGEAYCGGCWDRLEDEVLLAHHDYTAEDWNCHGLTAEVEQGVCLGCGELIGEEA